MNEEQVQTMVKEEWGFVPNLLVTMRDSPAAVRLYVEGAGIMAESTLNAAEQQVVYLTTSVFHECAYCTSAHSVMASGAEVARDEIAKLRGGELPSDERLAAISSATLMVLQKRGHLDEEDLASLADKGVTRANLYDIVALICVKTLTNWVSHFEKPQIDDEFTYTE